MSLTLDVPVKFIPVIVSKEPIVPTIGAIPDMEGTPITSMEVSALDEQEVEFVTVTVYVVI